MCRALFVLDLRFYLTAQKPGGNLRGLYLHFVGKAAVLFLHHDNRAVEIARRYDGKYAGNGESGSLHGKYFFL